MLTRKLPEITGSIIKTLWDSEETGGDEESSKKEEDNEEGLMTRKHPETTKTIQEVLVGQRSIGRE